MSVGYDDLKVITDNRGIVFESLDANAFQCQRNAHVVISLPGIIRGNHYHTFPPGIPHGIKNLSSQPNVLVAFNTIKHDPQNSDTAEEILMSG
jgi:UDP-2-acetamido-2,6-beta-L-arabino-hexul-4-ose reductase